MTIYNEAIRNSRARRGKPTKLTSAEVQDYFLLEDAYFAMGGFADGTYLRKHTRESDAEYKSRKELSHYQNFFASVVNASVNPIFSQEPIRETENALYKEFTQDVDRGGNDITSYMAEVTLRGEVDGAIIVIMDNFSDAPNNLGDAVSLRKYPYLYSVELGELEEYAFDRFGNLAYFRFFSENTEGGEELFRNFIRVGSQGVSFLSKSDGTEISGTRVVVPVFPYMFKTGRKPNRFTLPRSNWYTLAKTSKLYFNLNSLITSQEFQSTFNILTMQGTKTDLSMGEDSVIFYPKGHERPGFIAPESATIEILLEDKQKLKEYIYQISHQGLILSNGDVSGESKKWTDKFRQEKLKFLARAVEDLEIWIAQSFALWTNTSNEIEIRYPRNFDTISLSEELEDALKLLDMGISPDNAVRVKSDALLSKFSEASIEEKERIVAAEEQNSDYTESPEDRTDPEGAN